MLISFINDIQTQIATVGGITALATTVDITAGDGAKILAQAPNIGVDGAYTMAVITNILGQRETIKITDVTGDTLVFEREQEEDDVAQAWAQADIIYFSHTAAMLHDAFAEKADQTDLDQEVLDRAAAVSAEATARADADTALGIDIAAVDAKIPMVIDKAGTFDGTAGYYDVTGLTNFSDGKARKLRLSLYGSNVPDGSNPEGYWDFLFNTTDLPTYSGFLTQNASDPTLLAGSYFLPHYSAFTYEGVPTSWIMRAEIEVVFRVVQNVVLADISGSYYLIYVVGGVTRRRYGRHFGTAVYSVSSGTSFRIRQKGTYNYYFNFSGKYTLSREV